MLKKKPNETGFCIANTPKTDLCVFVLFWERLEPISIISHLLLNKYSNKREENTVIVQPETGNHGLSQ